MLEIAPPDRPRELGGAADPLPRPSRPAAAGTFRVRWSDLDLNRHANHTRYVEWALEAVPPDLRERGRLAGLGIDFLAEARLGDEVAAEAEAVDGGLTFLHRILRPADGRELAVLRSAWTEK
jgi:acyl-CoA thioesterase FadM